MKPEHDLRRVDDEATTTQNDSSDQSATPSEVLPDIEKGEETPPEQVRTVTGFKWFLFLSSTLTGMFVYALDNTIVADIIPAIINDFNSIANLPWLSVGFMIGGLAMIMPYGKLYNLFDAKWVYIASFILFLASSALCGGAPTMNAEIVGRVFAGAGGNGMYLGLLTLISVNTTDKERPAWLSLSGLVWGVGTVLGPVVGGGFQLYTWRWAFYINLLFGAILLPIYLFILPSFDPAPGQTFLERARRFDMVGALISIGAFVCTVMLINFGGLLYDWKSGSIKALAVVGILLWIVFAIQQSFTIFTTTENRIFPVHFLKHKERVLLFIAGASGGAAIYITIYYIPIFFQFTHGDTAIMAAVRLLPFVFILSALVLANGALMARWGYYTPWYIGGSILTLIGSVLMSRININTSPSAIYGYEVLIAFGTGSFVQAGYAVIQSIVPQSEVSYGITYMMVAQLSGLAFGLSVAGAIFLNLAQNQLTVLLPTIPKDQIQQFISGTSGALFHTLSPDDRHSALVILVNSLRTTFIGGYAAAAAALICAVFMSHKKNILPQGTVG